MNLNRFNEDDIHELRIQLAEKRRCMTKEDADKDLREGAERTQRAIAAIRKAKGIHFD